MPVVHVCTKKNYNDTPEWVININEQKRLRFLRNERVMILEATSKLDTESWMAYRIDILPKFKSFTEFISVVNQYTKLVSQ